MRKTVYCLLIMAFVLCTCVSTGGTAAGADSARENKERLLEYLREEQGKHIISGQMDTAWSDTNAHKQKVYRHPYVITLDKLPVLSGGFNKP